MLPDACRAESHISTRCFCIKICPCIALAGSSILKPCGVQVPNGVHLSSAQQNGHATHAMPAGMTDLERQFFATQSPSSESSESSDSEESDDDDNENDGFEHF